MGGVNRPILSESEKKELEKLFPRVQEAQFVKTLPNNFTEIRRRRSKDVGNIVAMCDVSVKTWVKR